MIKNAFDFLDNYDPKSHDFTKEWKCYWVKRILVYYQKDLRQIIRRIGAYYQSIRDNGEHKEFAPSVQVNGTSEHSNEKNNKIIDICGGFIYQTFTIRMTHIMMIIGNVSTNTFNKF